MSDETELPPLDAGPDEWADKWDEPTTITVNRWVKAHLDHDRDGQPWNEYLESLRQHKADPLTYTNVEQITDALIEELDLPDEFTYTREFVEHQIQEAASELDLTPDYDRIREIVRQEVQDALRGVTR